MTGASLTAAHYVQATRWRQVLKQQTLAAFRDIDVAITASSMDPACRIDDNETLAANGYIVVAQDVRGRFASDGEYRFNHDDVADGYDSVGWAAGLPGSPWRLRRSRRCCPQRRPGCAAARPARG